MKISHTKKLVNLSTIFILSFIFVCFVLPFCLNFNSESNVETAINDLTFKSSVSTQSLLQNYIVPAEVATSNFMSTYFYALNTYHYNNDDSCCYVALQMLLSYYNHYFTDDLVKEEFETSASKNYSSSVHSPGTTEGLFNELVNVGFLYGHDKVLHHSEDLVEILTHYMEAQPKINLSDWYITSSFNSNPTDTYIAADGTYTTYGMSFISEIKSLVKSKIPVITLFYENGQGHACIAYAYDDTVNQLVYNVGWKISFDKSLYIGEESFCVGYVALMNKNAPHVHSTNFLLDNKNVCACCLPNHEHITYSFSPYNKTNHKSICYCGTSVFEAHHFKVDLLGKNWICTDCGYSTKVSGPQPPIHLSEDLIKKLSTNNNYGVV